MAAGDIVLSLDKTLLQSELAIVESQLFEIMARRARLEAERDGAQELNLREEFSFAAAERPEVQELINGHRPVLLPSRAFAQ